MLEKQGFHSEMKKENCRDRCAYPKIIFVREKEQNIYEKDSCKQKKANFCGHKQYKHRWNFCFRFPRINVNEKSCNPTSFGQQKKSKTKTPRHSKVNQISEFRYKI